MSLVKVGAVLLVTLVLQLTVFVDVRVFGVAPEILALVAVLAGFLCGPERGATIAFAAGLLWDIWLPTPLGLAAMSYALVAFAVGTFGAGLFYESRVQIAGVVGAATGACIIGYALLGEVVGQRGLVDLRLLRIALIAGAINALLVPVVHRPLRAAFRAPEVSSGPALLRP